MRSKRFYHNLRRSFAMIAALLLMQALPMALQAQTFALTGSMSQIRDNHTATLLPNGKVLIVGGVDSNFTPLASSELYDAAAGTFSMTGTLANARLSHTATLLPNGKVLMAGGADVAGTLATVEIYDPATGTYSTTTAMNMARQGHTATPLANGKVLIAGGFGLTEPLGTAELFDLATGTFSPIPGTMSAPRYAQTATLLPNGRVLIVGGYGLTGALATAETYDPATNVFSSTGAMSSARYFHTATLVGDKVLIAGGYDDSFILASAELFNPATGSFSATAAMTSAHGNHIVALANGIPLISGGYSVNVVSSAELFTAASNSFAATGNMLNARAYHTATTLANGKVLVAGGNTGSASLASAELYTPAVVPVPTVTFTVNNSTINQGQSASLTWDSSNATGVTINGASVVVDGTMVVSPSATTTYNLTASGLGGSVQSSVTVTVIIPPPPPAPTVIFTVNNSTINQGQSASLTWDSSNVTAVTINGASVVVDGTMIVSPAATTTYNLTASGLGGSVQSSVTVTVIIQPVALTVAIDVKPGESANTINIKSKGVIPVAILSSATFDASTQVDITTLTFGHTGNEASLERCAVQPANAAGRKNLMCHFDTQKAAFLDTDTTAVLKGKSKAGVAFQSTDTVRILK